MEQQYCPWSVLPSASCTQNFTITSQWNDNVYCYSPPEAPLWSQPQYQKQAALVPPTEIACPAPIRISTGQIFTNDPDIGAPIPSPQSSLCTLADAAIFVDQAESVNERRSKAFSSSTADTPPERDSSVEGVDSGSRDTSTRNGSTSLRDKRHPCTMCHKSFDRPSTLKKHWLVHTGEKAFACEICGRRFGVPSNLNRHTKKCILKPVNAAYRKAIEANRERDGFPDEEMLLYPADCPTDGQSQRRSRAKAKPVAPPGTTVSKRRRRAPSPVYWIPSSLKGFNLRSEEFHKCTPVPLPPVSPCAYPYEERNSWDENVGAEPYHPREWDKKGRLPGPAILLAGTCGTLRR